MRIGIIGPGAMGCLFTSKLALAGEEVVLIDHDPERARLINERGVVVHGPDSKKVVPAACLIPEAVSTSFDLVLVAVKAYQTESAAATCVAIGGDDAIFLTVQNGLGGADALARTLPVEQIALGTTAQGATLLGDGEIRQGGDGPTVIGPLDGKIPKKLNEAAETLNSAGIATSVKPDVMPVVWNKLAINCGINALTALTGVRNGCIGELPEAARVASDAVLEVARVAAKLSIELGDEETLARSVLDVARATAVNRSSMGQDVDRKQLTEIDYINGALVRQGESAGVDTPVNRTLYGLVKTLESTFPAR